MTGAVLGTPPLSASRFESPVREATLYGIGSPTTIDRERLRSAQSLPQGRSGVWRRESSITSRRPMISGRETR
jgi:hypothetical protein